MSGTPQLVLNAIADRLDNLADLFRSPHLANALQNTPLRKPALLGALFIVLWFLSSKKRKATKKGEERYVTDHSQVARRISQAGEYGADEFDVIVVGGGTAGCALASRLSEDPSIRVLLLEAGQSSRNMEEATIPAAASRLFRTSHDWEIYTEPQEHATGWKRYWPRAKVLGGCSAFNAMMFHYGAPSDYDEWAQLQKGQNGAIGWSYKEFYPYFRKFERYSPSNDYPAVDLTLRGAQGVVTTGLFGYCTNISRSWIEACKAAGIAHSHDVNTHKGTLGVTKVLTYIDRNGRRVTTERAYLTAEVLARPNLKVAINANVARILFDQNDGKTRAVGVEFTDPRGVKYQVVALKEVVLSAGAIHTPHLLLLSGIGPSFHLSSLDIPVVADLPGVGSHLKDHAVIDLNYKDKSKTSLSYLRPANLSMTVKALRAMFQYRLTGKGPLTTNIAEAVAFLRSDDPDLFPPSDYPPERRPNDVTTGKAAPDIEIYITPLAYRQSGTKTPPNFGQYNFASHTVLLRPQSSGTVRLRSKNPADLPIVDPNYLADPNDVRTLILGMRILDRISHTEPFASFIDPVGDSHSELHHNLSRLSDADLEKIVREKVDTLYHPACTARMAPREDGGVVDPFLRVHGIEHLRIADASVFPEIVSGHTAAPVIAIAEKAADMIKKDIGSKMPVSI